MRIQIAIPEDHVSKPVLDGALEAVTRLDESLIRSGASPTSEQLIERGAKWRPEPPGQEHFDHGAILAKRGHGDCDDWAPLRAATLRVTGEDPGARAVVRKSGEKRWHATVIRSDGSEDDPSLDAGMPGPAKAVGVRGAWLPIMRERVHGVGGSFIATPHLALRPVADRHGQVESWQARADLPWHWQPGDSPSDLAMVTLHQSPVSDQAVVGAVRGAWRLGLESGVADPEQLQRLSAIAEACEGATWEDIAESYGPEHANAAAAVVGGFFGKALRKLGRGIKSAAKGVAKGALKFGMPLASAAIPGAGLATAAFNMASPGLKRAVMRQHHVPAPQRQPVPMRMAPPPQQHGGGGFPNFLPYPYPLPYPVPGWPAPGAQRAAPAPRARAARAAPSARRPGVAWPRG